MTVKKRAVEGKEAIKYLTYVRMHEGSLGCRRAHEVFVMAGCAGAVMGDRCEIEAGRCCLAAGKRMGETKDGQRSREMSARPSTMSNVAGQDLSAGYVDGRCWMYSGLRFKMKLPKFVGKQSRSKTKACRSWPQANGISIQLPTQSGLPLLPQIPFSSAAL